MFMYHPTTFHLTSWLIHKADRMSHSKKSAASVKQLTNRWYICRFFYNQWLTRRNNPCSLKVPLFCTRQSTYLRPKIEQRYERHKNVWKLCFSIDGESCQGVPEEGACQAKADHLPLFLTLLHASLHWTHQGFVLTFLKTFSSACQNAAVLPLFSFFSNSTWAGASGSLLAVVWVARFSFRFLAGAVALQVSWENKEK